jgi:hypothetical protein
MYTANLRNRYCSRASYVRLLSVVPTNANELLINDKTILCLSILFLPKCLNV